MPIVKCSRCGEELTITVDPSKYPFVLGGEYVFSEKTPNGLIPMRKGVAVEVLRDIIIFEFGDGSHLRVTTIKPDWVAWQDTPPHGIMAANGETQSETHQKP